MTNRAKLQLDRLYKHYMDARTSINYIAIYDLTHTLRVWTELADEKMELGEWYSRKVFKTAQPSKKLKKLLHNYECEYLMLHPAFYNHGELMERSLFLPTDLGFKPPYGVEAQMGLSAHSTSLNGYRGYYLGTTIEGFDIKELSIKGYLNLTQFLGG